MDSRKAKLRQRLEAARRELLALLQSATPDDLKRPSLNAGWTVQDIIAHLAAAEQGHQQVIRSLLAGQNPDLPDFDLDVFNEKEVAARRGQRLAALLDELAVGRAETLSLLEVVAPEDWDRAGRHPGGFDTTVEGTFRIIAIHEKRHLKEIQAALLDNQ